MIDFLQKNTFLNYMILLILILSSCSSNNSKTTFDYLKIDDKMPRDTFDQLIKNEYQKEKIPVLYFTADWCAPCKEVKKNLEDKEVKKALNQFTFVEIDLTMNPSDSSKVTFQLSRKMNIRVIPSFGRIDENSIPKNKMYSATWLNNQPRRIDEFIEKVKEEYIFHSFDPEWKYRGKVVKLDPNDYSSIY